jgi:ketosteroid isomerase-like protein
MASENVRLIREGYAALNRGDVEWLRSHADPNLEFRSRFSALSRSVYTGEEAVEQWYADVRDSWESIEQTPQRIVEVDDERTVVEVRIRARGRGSGAEIDQRIGVIFTVRDGKAVRLDAYESFDEALETLA